MSRRRQTFAWIGGGFVLLILIGAVAGSPKKQTSSTTTSSATATTSTPVAAPKLSDAEKSARDWIHRLGPDANRVQANVLIIQLDVNTKADINKIALDAQTAHDRLDSIRQNFANAPAGGALGDAELKVFTAANDLKNAMGALVSYTGSPNPASLAQFTTQYQGAVAEWDDGVSTIWRTARKGSAPTL